LLTLCVKRGSVRQQAFQNNRGVRSRIRLLRNIASQFSASVLVVRLASCYCAARSNIYTNILKLPRAILCFGANQTDQKCDPSGNKEMVVHFARRFEARSLLQGNVLSSWVRLRRLIQKQRFDLTPTPHSSRQEMYVTTNPLGIGQQSPAP